MNFPVLPITGTDFDYFFSLMAGITLVIFSVSMLIKLISRS